MEDVIPILVVACHCQSTQLVTQCVDRVARSDLDTICLEKELPFEVSENIKLLRLKSQADDRNEMRPPDPLHEKRVRRIHKALDSDDVELVKLLLSESNITLDEAYALHYAAAYCDPKVVSEVLGLGLANVNLLNARGYTVLHVAATRKEPSIIVSLLNKGAHASEMTSDGRSAVSICRRQTRPKDYHAKKEQGQETNKDRICIDVLEREMWRNPMAAEVSMSSPTIADDLHMKLLYLENRGNKNVLVWCYITFSWLLTFAGYLRRSFRKLLWGLSLFLLSDICNPPVTSCENKSGILFTHHLLGLPVSSFLLFYSQGMAFRVLFSA